MVLHGEDQVSIVLVVDELMKDCVKMCMFEGRYQYIGLVICYASDVIKCDRRTPELSNTPLHMK